MKTALAVTLAFVLVYAVFAAPADGVEALGEKKRAREQHSFHFYNTVEEEADHDLIDRPMQSQDAVKIQGLISWIKSKASVLLRNCGMSVLKAAIDCFPVAEKKAKEQYSFHFYDKAVKEDEQLIHGLLHSMLQSEEDETPVAMQGFFSWLKERAEELLSSCKDPTLDAAKKCIMESLFTAQARGEEKKVEVQHIFHFSEKSAKQDEYLLHNLLNRVLQE